jgi:molybdate transport system substrate-binding protein
VNAETIHVAAAANLQQVFDKALLPAFTKATGIAVVPTYGSTKLLAVQIENGAPVDVFVAADKETPDKMTARGELDRSTERVYAYGKLVFWSRRDAAAPPKTPVDLTGRAYTRIAIANPQLAPYGQAAMAMIDRAHLSQALHPKIVFAENIAQTLQYARSGNASVAITALSLVISDKSDPYVVVPQSDYPPIAQAAAVVRSSKDPNGARKFMAFLTSPQAKAIWKRYGYGLPR